MSILHNKSLVGLWVYDHDKEIPSIFHWQKDNCLCFHTDGEFGIISEFPPEEYKSIYGYEISFLDRYGQSYSEEVGLNLHEALGTDWPILIQEIQSFFADKENRFVSYHIILAFDWWSSEYNSYGGTDYDTGYDFIGIVSQSSINKLEIEGLGK